MPIEQLSLTVRCYNVLKRDGINTVGELAVLPQQHLMGLRNFTSKDMGCPAADRKSGRLRYRGPAAGAPSEGQLTPIWEALTRAVAQSASPPPH